MPGLLSKKEVPERREVGTGDEERVTGKVDKSYRDIVGVIEAVRRRRRAKRAMLIALVALGVMLGALVMAMLLLPALDGVARNAARAVLLLALFGPAAAGLVMALLRRESVGDTARAIERANPGLNNALINAVQLEQAKGRQGPAGAFSAVFLEAHLKKTANLIPGLDLEAAAPSAALKRPAIVAGSLFMALILALLIAPDRGSRGLSALLSDPWTTPKPAGRNAALPLTTGDFTVTYKFPAYSRIEDHTVPNTNGDLGALKGTVAAIETRVLEPLASADLVTSNGARYHMAADKGTRLKVELALSEPGTYVIEGVDERGRRRAEESSHRIVVDEDLAPTVSIAQPIGDTNAAIEDLVTVRYMANDDFGLSESWLVYDAGAGEKRVQIRTLKDSDQKELDDRYDWPLADSEVKPGDRVTFWLEVFDNDVISGPKVGKSDARVVEIFSARKEHRKLLARQDELLNMLIDHLAAHLDAEAAATGDPNLDLRPSERELLAAGSDMVSFVEDLYNETLNDQYADELIVDTLADMQARYFQRLAERSKIVADGHALSAAVRAKVLALREEYRIDLENDVLFLDRLIKKERVNDLLSEMDELSRAQSDLADLLAEYNRTQDPATLDQIKKAMADLEEAWQNLMERMAAMRKEMPEEFVNQDAFKGSNVMSLEDRMEQLRKALADGDLENMLAMANQLLDDMDAWKQGLQDSADDYNDMMSRQMSEQVGEIEDRLDDLIQEQMDIEDDVSKFYEEGIRQSVRNETGDDSGSKFNPFEALEQFQSEINSAMNTFYAFRRGAMDGKPRPVTSEYNDERRGLAGDFSQVKQAAMDMSEQLGKGNLERALETGENIEDVLDQLRADAQDFAERHDAGPQEARDLFHQDMDNAESKIDEIMDRLEDLKDRMEMSLSAEQQRKLDQLSSKQKQNRQATEELRDQYDQLQSQMPALPAESSESMGRASGHMYDSAGEMELGNPGRAQLPSREARTELEKAKDALGKAKQKMMKGSGGQGMPGMMSGRPRPGANGDDGSDGGTDTHDIKLPDENAYQVPEQFRQELLKAMKEGSPDAYKNLNKDYYERLVR